MARDEQEAMPLFLFDKPARGNVLILKVTTVASWGRGKYVGRTVM